MVTTGTEQVAARNKFLQSYVKQGCCLWAQPRFNTFHELIIIEVLRSQLVFQLGEEAVVAWCEIRAIRRVVKQLPVEMLQQCSSASSCTIMRTRIVMEEHYTGALHICFLNDRPPTVILMFCNTLLTLLWSLVARHPPSAPLVPENSVHQLSGRKTTFV
jgi:hypothetical protein